MESTGLQFVVIALIAETPSVRATDSVDAFGTPTVVHFCLALLVSALLSAPWPGLDSVHWVLGAIGLGGLLYTLIVLLRARRQSSYRPVLEDWVWHIVLPLLAYGALTWAALGLIRAPVEALFVVAAVTLLLIFIGIHNAWDAVAYVAMQHRKKTRE